MPRKTIAIFVFFLSFQWVASGHALSLRETKEIYWRYAKDLEKNWKNNFWTSLSYVGSEAQYAYEYWQPRTQYIFDYWTPIILNRTLPRIQNGYKILEKNYGDEVASQYLFLLGYYTPLIEKNLNSIESYSAAHVPAFLKIKTHQGFNLLVKYITSKELPDSKSISTNTRAAYEFLKGYLQFSTDQVLLDRVTKLFNRLTPYMSDKKLVSCQVVHILKTNFPNALQSGCNVYLTEVIKKLNLSDDEIMGLLAHELSHEDEGHTVREYAAGAKNAVELMVELLGEAVAWTLTGHAGEVLSDTANGVILERFQRSFVAKSVEHEYEADEKAVSLLCRAGVSADGLKTAMTKMMLESKDYYQLEYGVLPEGENTPTPRDYPDLKTRMQKIEKAQKLCSNTSFL